MQKNLTSYESAQMHMISSFIQITLSLPFSHPIDTIKSRIQTRVYSGNFSNILLQIYKDGIFSMYKGYIPMYLNLVLKQPAKLAVYEHIQNPFISGLATGFTGLCVGIPMSYVKTNYQVHPNFKIKSLFNLGINGFTKSFVAWKYEGLKEIVGNTAFYSLYKIFNSIRLKNNVDKKPLLFPVVSPILKLLKIDENEQIKKIIHLENGAFAGFLGTYFSFPIDTMKSYKQTINRTGSFKLIFNEILYQIQIAPEHINNIKQFYPDNKPSYLNFWRGSSITAIKHGVVGGVGMLLYESIKPLVKNYILLN